MTAELARAAGLAVLVALAACGGSAPKRIESPVVRDALPKGDGQMFQTLVEEGNKLWAERGTRAKLEGAIAKWSEAVSIKGDDSQTFARLAQAVHLLGDGFLYLDGNTKALLANFEKGYLYAERGLMAQSREFERKRKAGKSMIDSIVGLGPDAVPLVLWYASNLGSWVHYKGRMAGMSNRKTLLALNQFVYDHDPDYHHRAADRFFGSYYAKAPSAFGGSMTKSLAHFKAAIAKAPDFSFNYVLMAEMYAVGNKDSSLFDDSIAKVLAAKPCTESEVHPCVVPDLAAEHNIALRKAQDLQSRRRKLF